MKYFLMLAIFSLISISYGKDSGIYGSPISLKNPMSIENAIKVISEKKNDDVLIKASVGKVCESKGCWMTLKSTNSIRITFKDYGFFVPLSLIGKEVLVQGKLIKHTMSIKEAKHFAKDAGKDPNKVTATKVEYRIVASGVKRL